MLTGNKSQYHAIYHHLNNARTSIAKNPFAKSILFIRKIGNLEVDWLKILIFAVTIKILSTMALEIKAIPTLKGKEAERFVKEADKAYLKKEKTDFSKQVKIARAILKKANML